MRTRYRLLALSSLVAALGGCAPVLRIPRYLTNNPDQMQRYNLLKHTYLLIEKPSNNFIKMDGGRFAQTVENRLAETGCHLVGYRVVPTLTADDPYIAELGPTSRLSVAFEEIKLSSATNQKDVKRIHGRYEITEKVTFHAYTMRLRVWYQWVLFPSSATIVRGELTPSVDKELEHEISDDERDDLLKELLTDAARAVAGQCGIASPGYRERTLLFVKDDEAGKKAANLAADNHCEKAQEIWTARKKESHGDWRDRFNEGACAERRRDFQNARLLYKEAQTGAQNDPDAAKVPWDKIYADMDSEPVLDAPISAAAARWYGHRIAVLPFSDETTSIDGPDAIRMTVHTLFQSGGYNTMTMDEVDDILRDHGFSDAGQFDATTPEKIAEWLHADWLVFGNIEEFNEQNIGIYDKREIAGTLRIWDAATHREIWSSAVPVKDQKFVLKGNILTAFLSNLGRTWAEHAAKFPLAAECIEFVEANFEAFPFLPEKG